MPYLYSLTQKTIFWNNQLLHETSVQMPAVPHTANTEVNSAAP